MRNVYIITHTESLHHIQKLGGGWFDSPLTQQGKFQASQVAAYLKEAVNNNPVKFYSSDLMRATQTCEIISSQFATGFVKYPELREMCFGVAEGKPQSWVSENIKYMPEEHSSRLDHRVFEGAESRRDIGTRVTRCLNAILEDPAMNIAIVSHGFTATFLIMAWLKVPVEYMDFCNFRVIPGSITLLQEDDNFHNRAVAHLNYTEHLKAI